MDKTSTRPKKNILIADDDSEHTMLFNEAFLNISPHTRVNVVKDGTEVLSHLKENRKLPDMIVLDINMPGMGGIEVLKEIKTNETYSKIPVIMFSASRSNTEASECYRNNASCVIRKPDDYGELMEVAQTLYLLMKKF